MGIIVRLNQQRTDCPPKSDFTTPKNHFIAFCAIEKSLPLYLQNWWLDAVCPKGNWRPCLSFDKSGNINGALVYQKVKLKGLFDAIVMPELTPNTGIWLRLPDADKSKQYSKYTTTKQILENLIAQLPNTAFYHQKFHYELTDWQPFFWQGFEGSPHFTYLLENINDLETTFNNFKGSVRTDIRKAERQLIIEESNDIKQFYAFCISSFAKQGMKPPFSFENIERLDKALKDRGLRSVLIAKDTEGLIHASVFIVFDKNSAHYLVGGSDVERRGSGALPFLLWAAIQKASARGLSVFDFEGSMIPSVEYAFRNFGARQVPYFRLTKTRNRFFSFLTLFFKNYR